jgi:phospholipase C
VLNDINNPDCKSFPQVSWVIPSFPYSDHGGTGTNGMGPDWVADIVEAIGNNGVNQCNYWSNTAIVVTWDDWGGFYDHVPIPQPFRNQYELGFRVPLLFVSAYTSAGFVSCPVPVGGCQSVMDFGSILQFIEWVFGPTGQHLGPIPPGTYADKLANPLDPGFYAAPFRQYTPITGLAHDASFFTTNQVSPSEDPDDD